MLDQVAQRSGAIEIAVKPAAGASVGGTATPEGSDVVWRCRLLTVSPTGLMVEMPMAVGRPIRIGAGADLLAAFTVGQNRWMFHTRVQGYKVLSHYGREHAALILDMPEKVERCSRREHFRISTSELNLPKVQCWPLLDPTSVIAAEAANRARIRDLTAMAVTGAAPDSPDSILLPDVGPMFEARLLNISSGGLGLVVGPAEVSNLDRSRHLWLRVDLRPQVPVPVALTTKRAHIHLDSSGNTYQGLCFEFSFNPEHQRFVYDLHNTYNETVQQSSRQRQAG